MQAQFFKANLRFPFVCLHYFNDFISTPYVGIILDCELRDRSQKLKEIDLLDLSHTTDVHALADSIVSNEPLLTDSKKPQVAKLLMKLIEKLGSDDVSNDFYLFKILRAHMLPLTNCAFNKSGDKFITGSYDRTCKIWDTMSGKELISLEGHRNVVYSIAFNNPFGDKVATGSFDRTCKLWNSRTGENLHTFRGHEAEVVCLSFNPSGTSIATGSMDNTARLYDIETGQCLHTLLGHTGEIVSVNFDTHGKHMITGSFDHTIKLWDTHNGKVIHTFRGHRGEVSSTQFNFSVRIAKIFVIFLQEEILIYLMPAYFL